MDSPIEQTPPTQQTTPRRRIRPLLLVGGVAVLAVAAILVYVFVLSGPSGKVTFSPSTISCSDKSTNVTISISLPSSVQGSSLIRVRAEDGHELSLVVDSHFKKQSDGTWFWSDVMPAQMACLAPKITINDVVEFTGKPGKHTISVHDASGKLLAEGSFTIQQ